MPDQSRGERGGGEQSRPDLHRLAIIRAGEQARAQAPVLALGDFGDDRADQRRRRADLHAGEEEGRARRRAELQERLRARRRIGAHEVELQRIGRAEALDHADGDRKERTDRRRSPAFGAMPVMSNWLRMTTIIGASAMIGTVCEATSHGIIERSSQRMETMRTARPMPSTAPKANPISVSSSVMTRDRRGCASMSARS